MGASGFVVGSPLIVIRRIAETEIYGRATPSEVAQLHASPLLWLRSLLVIRGEVESHIAKNQRDLAALKPPAGVHPSAEYLEAKRGVDIRTQRRLHFLGIVTRRAEEVKALVGARPIDQHIIGDVIEVLYRVSILAGAGEARQASDLAAYFARRLAGGGGDDGNTEAGDGGA